MDRHPAATKGLESRAVNVAGSVIRELANAAMHRPGLIPLWFGESDRPTPDFISDNRRRVHAGRRDVLLRRSRAPLPA